MTPTTRRQALADRLEWVVDWLYPPRCRACAGRIAGRDSEYFCGSCWSNIRLVSHPLCTICGRPFLDASGDDHKCGACLSRPPRFVSARAWACYPREDITDDPLRQVVQRFKYGRKVSLGKALGRLMAAGCQEFLNECRVDLIIPVPLHPKRLRWRGFNQSVLLARQVNRVHGLPMDPFILMRDKETLPQTQLSEEERRKNVRGAFSVRTAAALKAKTLLLVDDVYTSGATLNECSRVLIQAGARKVHLLTLARTV
jgi:ComF family protein